MFVIVVFILPLFYLAAQALWNPRIEFLTPRAGANWVLAPDHHVRNMRGGPVSDDISFSLEFEMSVPPKRLEIVYLAFTDAVLKVNGVNVALTAPDHWKHAIRVDLAPHLRRGRNELVVRVHNPGSVAALMVTAPEALRTPGAWQATSASDPLRARPAVPPMAEVPRDFEFRRHEPGALVQWAGQGGAAVVVFAWMVLLIGAVAWALIRRPASTRPGIDRSAARTSPRRIASTVVLVVAFGCHAWNAIHYPHQRTYFDGENHIEYVEAVADGWRVPDPRDGFQMYQPPGYYFLAAAVYSSAGGAENREAALKAVQFLGAAAGFGLVLLTWWLSRHLFEDEASRVVATAFAAFLPMLLYCSPMISNETFSAFAIALAFCFVATVRDIRVPRIAILAGLLCALALLSKYTALFTVASAVLLLASRSLFGGESRLEWRPILAFLIPVLALSGWLYLRNLTQFGDPFVGNWDTATGFAYEQDPGYRTPSYYFAFGRLFLQPIEHAPWLSWPDGIYVSMWSDPFQSFLNPGDVRLPIWSAFALLLALWPTILIVVGFVESTRRTIARPFQSVDFLLVAVPAWSLTALLLFSLEVPFYSTVKAFFVLSLVPIFGVHLARGRNLVGASSVPVRIAGDCVLVGLALVNIGLYRYPVQ
ncbi:MAG: glycosyltransferase family 39 protein [Deltaproteobacteria bacterium]|nr:glycosyltransferase family 39 protein [Deltaproteobacteria bacterium]